MMYNETTVAGNRTTTDGNRIPTRGEAGVQVGASEGGSKPVVEVGR